MPTFYIENSPRESNRRRMATVYAKTQVEAEKKLLERFPDACQLRYIKEARLINPALSTTVIK